MTAETKWAGRFITVVKDGNWEYVTRARGIGAAVMIAITPADEILLVEQYRVPIGRRCLELPAGLVGDETAGEAIADAANRELIEETGYSTGRVEDCGLFYTSPGMSSEVVTLVRCHELTRVGPGGGSGDEDITVHHVPRADVAAFVAAKRREGVAINVKLLLLLADTLI